jgi:carboxyl-terminal processing protease
MIRLTIARYFTPTGRSIQSPYNEGYDKYVENFYKRYSAGEMISPDSVHFPDSLKFATLINKRVVYGGGGIMPDVFVPADTSNYTDYYRTLVRRNVFNTFVLEYSDRNRDKIKGEYKTFDDFKTRYQLSDQEIGAFIKKGEDSGVKYNESQFKKSENEMRIVLKALVANNIWQTNEYFRIINDRDVVIESALKVIRDRDQYNRILGYTR